MSGSSAAPASFLPAAPARPHSFGALLGLVLLRPGRLRSKSVFIVLLLLGGVGLFAFPAATDLFGSFQQMHVKNRFANPTFRDQWQDHKVKVGEGLTRLIIANDRVHVNVMVVEGTSLAALRAGAGHSTTTPYPCERGNVGITGHRTTCAR